MTLNTRTLYWVALSYFIFNALTQYLISGVADLDQSEQLIASQALLWGYGGQPPLYTWIVHAIFSITGASLMALVLFKAFLLSLTVLAILKIGELFDFSPRQQLITVLGLALIPQIIWESQRDLTHSVMATTMAAWLLYFVIRTLHALTRQNYVFIGVFTALALLSKYTLVIFIVALLLTLAVHSTYRQRLLHPYILLSIATAGILVTPHAIWVLDNLAQATQATAKLQMSGGALQGVSATLGYLVSFLTPLWLFALLLLPWQKAHYQVRFDNHSKFLIQLFLAVTVIALLIVILTQSANFKDRWFLPLLFFTPLIVAYFAQTELNKRLKSFIGITVFLAIVVAILLPARTIVGQHQHLKYDRSVLPFQKHFAQWSITTAPDAIISDNKMIAGNLKQEFKKAIVMTPESHPVIAQHYQTLLVACRHADCLQNPQIQALLQHPIATELQTSVQYIDIAQQRPHTIYWQLITLEGSEHARP